MHVPICESEGFLVGKGQMVYENSILFELQKYNLNSKEVIMSLDANQHTHETTCYYLLLNKWMREGVLEEKRDSF